jgi:sugar/nucleoside kinase (ribokinase family)
MSGIACAGHWTIDHIKFIDHWPQKSELCNITSELISNGGAPFNIIVDLANLKVNFPTYGIGCIGDDLESKYIHQICTEQNINIEFLQVLHDKSTSYTDVMTLQDRGTRTMFHCRGANSFFTPQHVPLKKLQTLHIKLFYLGHLLLMDALEKPDKQHAIAAGRLLHDAQQAGMETVVDIATESSKRYQKIVVPVLPYIDHFIINELEAEKTANYQTRDANNKIIKDGIKQAAKFLLDHGVNNNVVIHMPEGSYWLSKGNKTGIWHPSLAIPKDFFIAACGAGDAFCAGIMVGLHEQWNQLDTQRLATTCAAATINSRHNSNGIMPLKTTLSLADKFGLNGKIEYW